MARPSKREKELIGYVTELDYVSLLQTLSRLIGIPILRACERIDELANVEIEWPNDSIHSVNFPYSINSKYFNAAARRLELLDPKIQRQYLHFSDSFLDDLELSRKLSVPRITIQVDSQDRVDEIVVRISKKINLIEAMGQFFANTSIGVGVAGDMVIPTIETSLSEVSGLSLPSIIYDPAYSNGFNARLYALTNCGTDVNEADSLNNYLNSAVNKYQRCK